ncbi:MAG: hypothetical protein AABY15_03250 [Nanoarchaeota archaeon]
MSFNTIRYKLNLNGIVNINRYVGFPLMYEHQYESDVIPRIGEIITIKDGDFKNLEDSHWNKKKAFFEFMDILGGKYSWTTRDYEIKNIKHSKVSYSELRTHTEIEIVPVKEVIEEWSKPEVAQKFIEAFNKHVDFYKESRKKEEEAEKAKVERKRKLKRIFSLGILK